jgi:probable rRNA maturation factor
LVIFEKRIASVNGTVLERFALRARRASGLEGTVNLLLTSSAAMRSLNRQFRGKDAPTDVLSFPAPPLQKGKSPRTAGDIAISVDIAAENADKLGHSIVEEVKILILHGILHLAGFDHESDRGQMARREATLRQKLRLPVGLIERASVPRRSSSKREVQGTRARRTA